MTIFDHPLWPSIQPYALLAEGRDNLDILQPPDEVRAEAVNVTVPCVACGNLMHPFRVRARSGRSRVSGAPEERRLYYAATCPTDVNPGCSRTVAAKSHKNLVRRMFGRPEKVQAA